MAEPRRIDVMRRDGPVSVAAGATVTVISERLNFSSRAWIASYGYETSPNPLVNPVRFTILIDGVPQRDYFRQRTIAGTVPIPYLCRIEVPPGALVEVTAENEDPVNSFDCQARLTIEIHGGAP